MTVGELLFICFCLYSLYLLDELLEGKIKSAIYDLLERIVKWVKR